MSTENGKGGAEPEGYKNIQVYIEKKIRNLEKKKNRLDEYQKRQSKGEALEQQQKEALASMATVQCNLEFARDVLIHVTQTATEQERQAKKAEKRAKLDRDKRELELVEGMLRVQVVLEEMGNEDVKQAFCRQDGVDGVQLSQDQLDLLDQLYQAITPRREVGSEAASDPSDQSWPALLRSSSESCQHYLEAREDKRLGETTYRDVNELVKRLTSLPFFTANRQPVVKAPAPPPLPPPPPSQSQALPQETKIPAVVEAQHQQPDEGEEDASVQPKHQADSVTTAWSQPKQWADEPMPEASTANGSGFDSFQQHQKHGIEAGVDSKVDADGFTTYSRGGGRGARTSSGNAGGSQDFHHGGRGGGGGGFRGGERGGRGRGGGFGGSDRGRGGRGSGFGGGGGVGRGSRGGGGDRGGGGNSGFHSRSSYARHNSFGMPEQAAQQ